MARALLAAAAAGAAAPPRRPAITVPHLTGIFLSVDSETAGRDVGAWRRDFAAMRDVGIEWFCVRAVAVGATFNASDTSCPLGTFATYYPSAAPGVTRCFAGEHGNDALRTILTAARAESLQVHLGLGYPSSTANAYRRGENASDYFRRYAWLNWEVAQDLWQQYAGEFGPNTTAGTLAGFYTDLEESNTRSWYRLASDLAGHYLQPLARDIHRDLDPRALVWASPYFVGNLTRHSPNDIMDPTFYGGFWEQMFDWCEDLSLVAPQDSMGAQGNSFANVTDYLGAVARFSRGRGRRVWSNVELFEVWPRSCQWPDECHGRHPAPLDRIKAQLANEAPLADALIAWEWHSCLSPYGAYDDNATGQLYDAYRAYVHQE